MSPMREAYLLAAESAATLLADPAVAAGWTAPSALAEFTVGGLAEHLAQQILSVPGALVLEDFLVTRMMEVAVHSDDLAFSVGVPPPELPACVLDPVLALLSSLAVRRHGAPAVLRALSRAERAPATIAAF